MLLPPEIITQPTRTFAGLEARFIPTMSPNSNSAEVIPRLWSAFDARAADAKGIEPGVTYGLSRCNPSAPESAVYLAAVEVENARSAPRGFAVWTTPSGTYARFTHRGPIAKIGETIGYIYREWLPAGSYARVDGPDIERYDERFDPMTASSVMEILIPVQRNA